MNGTTSVHKSVPRFVLDKVRQVSKSEVLYSYVLIQNVSNKSLSQELNNFFILCCCYRSIKSKVLLNYLRISLNLSHDTKQIDCY